MWTPSLLGIALLCLSAMPAAMDNVHQDSLKQCDGQHKDWYRTGVYCIRFFDTPLSFADAESACRQASGSHLVSVHDIQTNEDVFSIVPKSTSSAQRIWLGGERVGQVMERKETWEQGRDIRTFIWTDGSLWNFWNWVPGEPDNSGNSENCVEMNWKIDREWNDDRCTKLKPFVCAFKRKQESGH